MSTSERLIPLSHPQRRVWLTERLYPDTGAGNLAGCIHFPGERGDLPTLARAIRAVVARHDALRIRLARQPSPICMQYFGAPLELELPILEVDDERAPLLAESRRPFALFDSPLVLFRLLTLPGERIGVFFKYHHINVDALTVSLLNREIYHAYVAGGAVPAEPPPSYAEFLERELGYLSSDQRAEDEAFWHRHLAGLSGLRRDRHPDPTLIPAGARSAIDTRRYEHTFTRAASDAIARYCDERKTSVFRFFLAVFAIYFAEREQQDEVVLATGHHNRLSPRELSMAGMTVSTLPIRLPAPADSTRPTMSPQSFEQYQREVHRISSACLRRQRYPFDILSRHLRAEGYDPKQLLRWIINHIPSFDADYGVERYSPGADLDELNIKINPNQQPKTARLQLGVDAQLGRYDREAVMRLFRRVEEIALEALADPRAAPPRLAKTTATRATSASPGPGAGVAGDAPEAARVERPSALVGTLFEHAARRFGDKLAVVDKRGGRSYRALRAQVAASRRALAARGVGVGSRVAIVMERRAEFVVAALAIIGRGAVYLPLTPDTPRARMSALLRDADVALVISDQRDLPTDRPCLAVDELGAELHEEPSSEPSREDGLATAPELSADDPAYCIYTSGSTGAPKGVLVPHRGLLNLSRWVRELYALEPTDRVAAFCSFMFDVSVLELFPALLSGATVYIIDEDHRRSVSELQRYLDHHRITVATLPTRVGELFHAHATSQTLRLLMVAGERLRPVRGRRGYRLINGYGPTEASVIVSTYELRGDEGEVPIGRPGPNTWLYVVDERERLVEPGQEGELWIAGEQLALGYLGAQEQTRASFGPNPFSDRPANARVYRTGDWVREDERGELLFLGRRDRQIKRRGFRVELGEIERCLLDHAAVEQCHVFAEPRDDTPAIVACYVASAAATARGGEALDNGEVEAELRARCRAQLPDYMQPDRFAAVAEIPLDRNGKVDERKLRTLGQAPASPASPSLRPDRGRSSEGAADPIETQLRAFFERVLRCPRVGLGDSFFERGGDSLAAMELFALIEGRFGTTLPVSLIFQHPTVTTLADALRRHGLDGEAPDILVSIKGGSRPQSLFCVHDFSCDVMSYTHVAQALCGETPIRGLRWDPQAPASTVEELAAHYLRALRRAQPLGPYYLLGYSAGGNIAYELARQLRESGQRVAFLGLVDAVNVSEERNLVKMLSMTALRWGLSWLRGMSLDYKVAFITATIGRVPNLRRLRNLIAAQRRLRAMITRYRPPPIDCEIVFFKARRRGLKFEADRGWRSLTAELEVIDFEDNHLLILNERNSARIARRIERALEPAGTQA